MTISELQFVAAAALILVPLERLAPFHHEQRTLRPGLRVDALHLLVSGILIRVGAAATVAVLSYASALAVPEAVHVVIRGQPGWMQFVQLFVLADFFFYLAHRLVHRVPWLWRFHAVHHSSEHMDWLATFRVHPVDQILNSTIIAVPAAALGFSSGPLLVYALVYRVHALLLHSNVNAPLGPLERVFASPRYHHWHHADERHAYDRNFGGQLVIWDHMFDTWHEPNGRPAKYGVGGTMPAGYIQQLLAPFRPKPRRRRQSVVLSNRPVDSSTSVSV